MAKLFWRMPCLDESREINNQEIRKCLFDGKVDEKRYLESFVQKFLLLNEQMLSFLGVNLEMHGTGNSFSIQFRTGGYIGAIPVRMPYDGLAHKDFQVFPRFENSDQVFSDLTLLLSRLKYSIVPEYADGEQLTLPHQLRPPMHYEAVKFIELFEKAQKHRWVKFETKKNNHNFPKSNTNWSKYAQHAYDPRKALIYPSEDSVLSVNHKEWQQLTYVFNIATAIIMQQNVPESIRYRYYNKITALQKKNAMIRPLMTNNIVIHANDLPAIKEAKHQGNMLLQHGDSASCLAWRIDMPTLFERYVQYIVSMSLKGMNCKIMSNRKIQGRGEIAQWGLKSLEPDMMVQFDSNLYIIDAKYKAHNYNYNQNSEILKETHRADLHQLLAYCSFSPEKNKTGILFYPAQKLNYRKINYFNPFSEVTNKVYLYGLPFGINGIEEAVKHVRNLFFQINE